VSDGVPQISVTTGTTNEYSNRGRVNKKTEVKPARNGIVAKWREVVMALFLMATVFYALPETAEAQTFKNCAAVKAKYPNGVAINFAAMGRSRAEINRDIYLRHQRLDRDKDGVICEDEVLQNPPTASTSTTTTSTTTSTTTIPRTCAQGGRCSIGDIGPGGGIVFYVARSSQIWGQALEAAPITEWRGSDSRAVWACPGLAIPAARGRNIGDGQRNTLAIIENCPAPGTAAYLADSLSIGGKDDWFLPSLEETRLLYAYRNIVPGLSGAVYWTSTEFDGPQPSERAYAVGFTSTNWPDYSNGFKSYTLYVRPIRYVR